MSYIGNTATQQAFTPAVDFFNGNGSTTAFTLSRPVASVAQVQAVISNVPQKPGDAFTVSGNTITFTSAPPSGTQNIYVYYTSPITQVIAPGQGTVSATALQDGSVTPAKLSTGAPSWDTSGNVTTTGTVNNLTVGRGAGSVSTNTAVGYQAVYSNTSGTRNSALGYKPLYSNTTGSNNNAFGIDALGLNTTGSNNTAFGDTALGNNTTAGYNTAVGYQAGYASNYTSDAFANNTFIGALSGSAITTGRKNTILGLYNGNQGSVDIRTATGAVVLSDGDGNPRMYSPSTGADWYLNQPNGGSNTALVWSYLGAGKWWIWRDQPGDRLNITPASFTSGVYLTNTATSWAAYSDRRIKSDIVDLDYGISTIMAMQPRRYTVTANGENSIGFIAQELKPVLPEAVIGEELEFSDDDTPQERSTKTMGVSKETIIPVLVKAIQELKAEFDAYKEAHP